MKKKINIQFLIITLLAILTTVSLSIFVFYELFKQEVMADLKTNTQLLVETDAWEQIVEKKDAGALDDGVKQLRLTLVDGTGEVILDTNAEVGSMDNHSARPEISQALQAGEGQAIRQSSTIGKNAFYYAIRLENGSVLRTAKEAGSITSVFESILPVIVILCVLLFALCMILSHFLTGSIIEPIENLADNLDASDSVKVYKELVPFVQTIKKQHEDIMRNATMRQEFTANVSHELKTPLTSISGYSELIESGMAADEDIVRFAAEIHKNSNRLLTLINDIIRLSELDQVEEQNCFEELDIYDIAQNCVEMLRLSAKKHDVTMELHGVHRIICANRQMMDELVYNLCDNAIRYNNPGGRVDITVDAAVAFDKTAETGATIIEVKDTGIGISKEHQERIFERFYRVDKSRSKSTGGTGLGLAIVKHIVAAHKNASLSLTSEPGKGTCIRVAFKMKSNLE